MTYSDYFPYIPAVIGVLLFVMYAFMYKEARKALVLPENAGKPTFKSRLQAQLLLTDADYAQAKTRHTWTVYITCLLFAATVGAWFPEATGWSGLFATWWLLLASLVALITSLILKQRLYKIQAHGIEKLRDGGKQAQLTAAHLFGDGRWYAQLQATTKYLIAALVCFALTAGCALFLW